MKFIFHTQANADASASDSQGRTCLAHARSSDSKNREEVVKLLLSQEQQVSSSSSSSSFSRAVLEGPESAV